MGATKATSSVGKVGVAIGVTRNLGNYNNVKIDGWLEEAIGPDEDFETAFDRLYKKVEAKIEEKLEEYEEDS